MSDSESFFSLPKIDRTKIPWVTVILVAINAGVFIWTELTGSYEDMDHMMHMGASYAPAIIEDHEYYRVVTSMFLHFGFGHLINNMFSLIVLGYATERMIGRIRFIILYMLSGILAGITSLVYNMTKGGDASVAAGASGAIFGLLGALLVFIIRGNHGRLAGEVGRFLIYLAICLYSGFVDTSVDHAAHLGGFIAGVLICLLMSLGKNYKLTFGG